MARKGAIGGGLGRLQGRILARFGLRARQIALITMLVSAVVMLLTVADIAHMTSVIVVRTKDQTAQLSKQILYAMNQELAHANQVDPAPNAYYAIASEHSEVRSLMESAIATQGPISYLYVTNEAGQPVMDEEGKSELAANQYRIDPNPLDLSRVADEGPYKQLRSVFLAPVTYEFREALPNDNPVRGTLHIGVSAQSIRRELRTPIETDLLIGLFAIVGAAIVAISSANLLLKPLEEISTSIDRLSLGDKAVIEDHPLPRDEVVSGVTARLRQLGERMAGDRSELALMRGRLRQVISHLEERLLLINRDGRVILASPEAETLLDAQETELTGLPIDETLGRDHPLVQIIERAIAERGSISRVALNVPCGSATRELLVSVQYIEDGGEPVGTLVSLRDFESFKKMESQWDLSKKLADLGRITSGVAHEVKNPLNAMVIHLEILRSKIESGNGADPRPQLNILDSEIKRLDRVVQTFLNFTRPVEVRLYPLDVNTLVDQVTRLAETEAKERGVRIEQELLPGPLVVKGDADVLKQALLNIIINGCQAMPGGGILRVVTARAPHDGSALIRITDGGIGINPDAHDRIFNLYYTTKTGGSGIGLAQAFRAVQLHNGQIRFESQVGKGTTFHISLPTR
ncbi:MAG TPA: ATP-binding protein [Blastocatellia bacterium]|nr:ATP-binding protein [Blastocatellia bacterium]